MTLILLVLNAVKQILLQPLPMQESINYFFVIKPVPVKAKGNPICAGFHTLLNFPLLITHCKASYMCFSPGSDFIMEKIDILSWCN